MGESVGEVFEVGTAAQELALNLWFGGDWSGEPLVPKSHGPDGTLAELLLMARDVAVIASAPSPYNTPIHWDGLRMRARAHLAAARDPAPIGIRRGFERSDVKVTHRALPYAAYFDTEDVSLRHSTFAGGLSSEVHRTVQRAADAVTMLPYDPVTDKVMLIEQFRPAAFVRGEPHPWLLEPVAGRCDGDEPVEEVARREAFEEAGLDLIRLERIAGYYPSPGAMTEYLTSFIGICDLSDVSGGTVHGLDSEDEDIRTHVLSFDEAFALIGTGEADAGPLILSLLWLARERERLRG